MTVKQSIFVNLSSQPSFTQYSLRYTTLYIIVLQYYILYTEVNHLNNHCMHKPNITSLWKWWNDGHLIYVVYLIVKWFDIARAAV